MSYQDAKELLIRYKNNECTEPEKAIVDQWLFTYGDSDIDLSEEAIDAIGLEIWVNIKPQQTQIRKIRIWRQFAVAAAVIVAITVGSMLLVHKKTLPMLAHDVAPGGKKAILTLANGNKIVLTNATNGILTNQQNVSINKTANGNVIYISAVAPKAATVVMYNTLTTPRGGQYELTLADGTKVTLDAASSITYPVAFVGNERKVTITGQVYFEVVHNAAKPFRVQVGDQTIEDIGTHFNINAYSDEPVVTTTLLEGAVKLSKGNAYTLLKPGQQGSIVPKDDQYKVAAADLTSAMAWKNGMFNFDHTDLQPLMRQISRWYDVDVVYNGPATGFEFVGGIKRNTNLSNVLKILQQSGISFTIEGKKLIVE